MPDGASTFLRWWVSAIWMSHSGPSADAALSHHAESRMIFARGALAGARFLVGKPAGLYSMHDVIGSL